MANFNLATGYVDLSMDDTKIIAALDKVTAKTKQLTEFIEKGQYQAWQKLGKAAADRLDAAQKKAMFLNRTIRDGKISAYLGEAAAKAVAFQKAIEPASRKAALGFAVATASISTFVAQASPDAWRTFTGSLQLIGTQLGQGFIPLFKEASRKLQEFYRWLGSLSFEQKKNIAEWVAWGVAVLGVIALLPKVIGLLGGVSSAISFLAAHPGWAAVLAAVTAITYASARLKKVWDEVDAKLQDIAQGKTDFSKVLPEEKKLADILPAEDRLQRTRIAMQALQKEKDAFEKRFVSGTALGKSADWAFNFGVMFGLTDPRTKKAEEFAQRGEFLRQMEESTKKGEAFRPGQVKPAGNGGNDLIMAQMWQQPSYTGLAEAYKSVQLNVLGKDPIQTKILEEQIIGNQIHRDNGAVLDQINNNLDKNKPVPVVGP